MQCRFLPGRWIWHWLIFWIWNWPENSHRWTVLHGGINQRCRWRAYLSFGTEYFSIQCSIFGVNTLILVALHKKTSLHPPSKLLYHNLAISDLCVGIIVGPLAVTYWISVANERWDICYFPHWAVSFSSHMLCAVSLLTLTAISVDRLLALFLGFRYRQFVTLKSGYITVISWYQYIVIALCLLATIFAYTKILFSLRQNQIHVQNHVAHGQPSQRNST